MKLFDVVIVGGGPVGLALAGDLGWRGNSVCLIEQSDGVVRHPKMDGIDLRVMEFCRRWGLIDDMKKYPFPKDYPQDMVFVTSLTGYELGRESFTTPSGGSDARFGSPSPETRIRCPQTFFDPILRRFSESFPGNELRFGCRYARFEEDADGVTVHFANVGTNEAASVRGRYLVACDGANSTVRTQLGIQFEGPGLFNYTTNVLFRSPDLFAYHDKRPGYRWIFIGPEGTYGTMSAINGRDQWRAQLFAEQGKPLTGDEVRIRLERMIGCPFEHEIVSTLHWARRELVADTYRKGRVFMAGDACHATSPTGGFGMNTGIKDAVDLAWKLDAELKGWAGPDLLDSYDLERRPSGARAVREASGNWQRMLTPGQNPKLLDKSYEGALTRYHVGRRFSATMLREWYKLGIDLGYVYGDSPICWPDETAADDDKPLVPATALENRRAVEGTSAVPPLGANLLREWQRLLVHLADGAAVQTDWKELDPAEVMIYRQTSQPGARAPHVWLADGRSTLDLFGREFVLLRLGHDAPDSNEFESAAAACGLPLKVVTCDETPVLAAYERRLVVVRPDGHVAWRGNAWPKAGCRALVDRLRGA